MLMSYSWHLQVTIVGKIISMREISSSNLIEMTLFDGTGTYMVHYYLNDDDDAVRIPMLPLVFS
jgi:RPA family protein